MGRILVVDDDPSICKTVGILLEDNGFVAATTTDPEEALAWAEGEAFDIVIVDLRMPTMKGVDFISAPQFATTPKAVMTAFPDLDSATECMRRGCTEYIHKPFRQEELIDAIERMLSPGGQEQVVQPNQPLGSLAVGPYIPLRNPIVRGMVEATVHELKRNVGHLALRVHELNARAEREKDDVSRDATKECSALVSEASFFIRLLGDSICGSQMHVTTFDCGDATRAALRLAGQWRQESTQVHAKVTNKPIKGAGNYSLFSQIVAHLLRYAYSTTPADGQVAVDCRHVRRKGVIRIGFAGKPRARLKELLNVPSRECPRDSAQFGLCFCRSVLETMNGKLTACGRTTIGGMDFPAAFSVAFPVATETGA